MIQQAAPSPTRQPASTFVASACLCFGRSSAAHRAGAARHTCSDSKSNQLTHFGTLTLWHAASLPAVYLASGDVNDSGINLFDWWSEWTSEAQVCGTYTAACLPYHDLTMSRWPLSTRVRVTAEGGWAPTLTGQQPS